MCFPHPWRARHLFVQVLLILLADVANAEASRRVTMRRTWRMTKTIMLERRSRRSKNLTARPCTCSPSSLPCLQVWNVYKYFQQQRSIPRAYDGQAWGSNKQTWVQPLSYCLFHQEWVEVSHKDTPWTRWAGSGDKMWKMWQVFCL